jgi:TetR/AcrR family transcriptional repressor of nem operon
MAALPGKAGRDRAVLLDAAVRLLRERGADRIGVADIVRTAGLRHGAFYAHFRSKEELLAEALKTAGPRLADYARDFLSGAHGPDASCVHAALAGAIAHPSNAARQALTETVRQRLAGLTQEAPGADAAARRQSAVAGYATMVGAMLLARIVDDPALSDDILTQARRALGAC